MCTFINCGGAEFCFFFDILISASTLENKVEQHNHYFF